MNEGYNRYKADENIKSGVELFFDNALFMNMTVKDFRVIFPPAKKNDDWHSYGGNGNRHEVYVGQKNSGQDIGEQCLIIASYDGHIDYQVISRPDKWKSL